MKSLGLIVATVAIANLLAIAGFVGWLAASNRLNMDRLRQVRAVLAPTIAEEEIAKAAEAEAEKKAAAEAAERAKMAIPPESAAERIEQNRTDRDLREDQAARQRKELDDLRRRLLADRSKLDEDRSAFETEVKAFREQRAAEEKVRSSEQFKQALATLEAQKAKDAQQVLKALLDKQQESQAVEYLAAMGERPRGKILAEFIKEDATLAARLLERLRARGLAMAAEGSAGASPGTPQPPQANGG
jgi:chemotaxis protein histidine kinase CheA